MFSMIYFVQFACLLSKNHGQFLYAFGEINRMTSEVDYLKLYCIIWHKIHHWVIKLKQAKIVYTAIDIITIIHWVLILIVISISIN